MAIAQRSRREALTLLEVLLVIVVLGTLASLLIPRAVVARHEAAEKACYHNRLMINSAIERYAVTNDNYPSELSDLNGNEYFPEGIPSCPVSGHAYTIDGGLQRVQGHAAGVHP